MDTGSDYVNSVRKLLQKMPRPFALVPTMGALHEGHLELMKSARQEVGKEGTVIVSLFVNPMQFDKTSDLENYPQELTSDLALCEEAGVDLTFTPKKEDIYHGDHSVILQEGLLTKHLCGATRPGHFDGVLTIVLKLFNIFQPDVAVFGKKDFQQLALIRRMVRDLNLNTTVVGHPTVRDHNGLALSSRNARLSDQERGDASRIRRALLAARDLCITGERDPKVYLDAARKHLLSNSPEKFSIDYLELVDAHTLQPLGTVNNGSLIATACFYGKIRLIDHTTLIF